MFFRNKWIRKYHGAALSQSYVWNSASSELFVIGKSSLLAELGYTTEFSTKAQDNSLVSHGQPLDNRYIHVKYLLDEVQEVKTIPGCVTPLLMGFGLDYNHVYEILLCFHILVVIKWCSQYNSLFKRGRTKTTVL